MNFRSSLLRLVFCFLLPLLGCSHQPKRPDTTTLTSAATALYEENGRKLVVESWLERAKEAYKTGNFAKATRFLETAFVYDPTVPDAAATDLLHYLYLSQADYARALRLARALVKKDPYRANAYYQLGLAELWSGNAQLATEHFRRGLEFTERPARLHFYLGLAYEKLNNETAKVGEFQAAEKELRQTLKRNPKDFAANFELAHLYLYWNGHWQKAEELMGAARKSLRHPDFENSLNAYVYNEHHLNLLEGMYFTQQGDTQKAMTALWQALTSAPDGAKADVAEIYYYLGINYAAIQAPQAGNFLRKSAQMDPYGPYAGRTELALRGIAAEKPVKKGKRRKQRKR